MKQRSLIKSQIIKAWNKCINEDYCNQRVNSERSLQASFWSHLNHQLSNNRRLFIEPSILIKSNKEMKKIVPDIVVCNTKEVISVIELKYTPRIQPVYKKDIRSLSLIAENRNTISIANERYRGKEKDSHNYLLSKNILFVWAGVHAEQKKKEVNSYSYGNDLLENCYLELHAETKVNSSPSIYQK